MHITCDMCSWTTDTILTTFLSLVLTYLPKAFDCISRELINLLHAAQVKKPLCFMYLHLKNKNQCVRINNVTSHFEKVSLGVDSFKFQAIIIDKIKTSYRNETAEVKSNNNNNNIASITSKTLQNLWE